MRPQPPHQISFLSWIARVKRHYGQRLTFCPPACLDRFAINGYAHAFTLCKAVVLLAIRFIAMTKERNLDKERKTTLPNTVSKLNPRQNNSLRSNKFCPVIVSLRDCRKCNS